MKGYVENAKVVKVFDVSNGNVGVTVVEEDRRGDKVFKTFATLWFRSRPEVQVGDLINASGFVSVSARLDENGQARPNLNVNGPRIQSVQPGAAPREEPPADDGVWASDDAWGGESKWG